MRGGTNEGGDADCLGGRRFVDGVRKDAGDRAGRAGAGPGRRRRGKSDGYGEASLTVEWQVYASLQKAVVYTTQQKGYAKIDSSVAQPMTALWREAYANAVRGLLADPGFIALINGAKQP